jgi:hypothetical protein
MSEATPNEITIPDHIIHEFMNKFRPCQPGETPDEKLTTTELHQLFNEHLGGIDPVDVTNALNLMGFTSSLDAGRMQYLWNLKSI